MELQIAPSILSADFAHLGEEADRMEQAGVRMLHVDVMDGVFVPNISLGLPVLASLRRHTKLILDVHLMIADPLAYVEAFGKAGADLLTFHVESSSPVEETIEAIGKNRMRCGLTLKPETPVEQILPFLPKLDMVLVMTVEPGFGGQRFRTEQCEKIAVLRREMQRLEISPDIEVDGGINEDTIGRAAKAGANVFVAGSALFGLQDYKEGVRRLLCQAQASL